MVAPLLPDLVARDFSVGEPGLRACRDITHIPAIPTNEGWFHGMASVVGLGLRRLIGYCLGDNMRTGLVSSALTAAGRHPGRGPARPRVSSQPSVSIPHTAVPPALRGLLGALGGLGLAEGAPFEHVEHEASTSWRMGSIRSSAMDWPPWCRHGAFAW